MTTILTAHESSRATSLIGEVNQTSAAAGDGIALLASELGVKLATDPKALLADVAALLGAATARLDDAEGAHGSEQLGRRAPAAERDELVEATRSSVRAIRTALVNQYGPAQVAQVFAGGRTPREPKRLAEYAAQAAGDLPKRAAGWKAVRDDTVPVDVASSAAKLGATAAKLAAALGVVAEHSGATHVAHGDRDAARERVHHLTHGLKLVASGLLEIAGHEDLAETIVTHHHAAAVPPSPSGANG